MTMTLPPFLRALCLCAFLGCAQAAEFDLLSPEQMQAERQAQRQGATAPPVGPRTRSLSAGPLIKVVAPKLDGHGLRAPLRIELLFEPVGQARINPASLKVLYGFLGIDLTAKIRDNATVTEKGVLAEQARIPAGSHKLRIQVADTLGRVGETELRFQVED